MGLFLKFALFCGLVSSSRALDVSMIQAAQATTQAPTPAPTPAPPDTWSNLAPVSKPGIKTVEQLDADRSALRAWAATLASAPAAKPKPADAHSKTEKHMEQHHLGLATDGAISTDGLLGQAEVDAILNEKANSKGIAGLMARSDQSIDELYNAMSQEEKDDARKDANLKATKAYFSFTPDLSGEYDKKKEGVLTSSTIDSAPSTTDHFAGSGANAGLTGKYDYMNKQGKTTAKDSELKSTQASSEDRNTTNETRDDFQLDARTNKTENKETPQLYTNRSGYVKSSWKASDKFAAWEVVEVVDNLLASATNVDSDTGSVGRVGKGADERQYSVGMQDYRSARKPNVTTGY